MSLRSRSALPLLVPRVIVSLLFLRIAIDSRLRLLRDGLLLLLVCTAVLVAVGFFLLVMPCILRVAVIAVSLGLWVALLAGVLVRLR